MNILTFDIEDWFHIDFNKDFNIEQSWGKYPSRIARNTDIILDVLEEKNIKATFFSLGWVARKHPEVLRKIQISGHEIGSHSDIHNLMSNYTYQEFDEDLKRSIGALENAIGQKIKLFRAPAFSVGKSNLWIFDILIKYGIDIDCSVFPANHDFGGFPELNTSTPFIFDFKGSKIKEFPMSTYNLIGKQIVVTGGGYFRFFPYQLIKYYINRSTYNMTYFHPRDLDPDQPYLENLSSIRKFKSYYGLKNSLIKFKRLLNDFHFISVLEADVQFDWDTSKSIFIDSI